MPQIKETILAPALDGGEWLQGGPIKLEETRGQRIVLIDFWDYTCVNCVRTLPYVSEWSRRYAKDGLTVVGVHAPEFSFAHDHANVVAAIQRFGLDYPIMLDNDYAIWRAYSNRCWPAKYLIDAAGRLRYYHFGEGSYEETENAIQGLLRELNPSLEMPPPVASLRDTDRPGAICYRVTPELYLGHQRGQFGNPQTIVPDAVVDYVDPGRHVEGLAYLGGRWTVGGESARAETARATLALRYTAAEVNLVMTPSLGGTARVEVVLDEGDHPGADVEIANDRNFVTVEQPRMYQLVASPTVRAGSLKLIVHDSGLNVFAFTFISCVVN